jgi:hypothetical protein
MKKTYDPGAPCHYGHVSPRYVTSGACVACVRERYESRSPGAAKRREARGRRRALREARGRGEPRPVSERAAYFMVSAAKHRAKKKGLPFDLTEDYVLGLLDQCGGRCPVLGVPFVRGTRACRRASPSLDRVDPAKGYVEGNVVVVSMRANAIKNDATWAEIQAVAKFYQQWEMLS